MQNYGNVCFSSCCLRKGPENWSLFWPLSQAPRMNLHSSFLPLLSHFHESWVPGTLGDQAPSGQVTDARCRGGASHDPGEKREMILTEGDFGVSESCLNKAESLTQSFLLNKQEITCLILKSSFPFVFFMCMCVYIERDDTEEKFPWKISCSLKWKCSHKLWTRLVWCLNALMYVWIRVALQFKTSSTNFSFLLLPLCMPACLPPLKKGRRTGWSRKKPAGEINI